MKRKILSMLTALALCLSLLPGAVLAAEESTSGNWTDGLTQAPEGWSESEDGSTITITTPEALAWLAAIVNDESITTYEDNPTFGKTVVLGADLDLSGKNWVPIGNGKFGTDTVNAFIGDFDGNGHTISNLTIDDSSGSDRIGLFGNVYLNGSWGPLSIQNVTVENASITTNGFTGSGYVGVLAGQVIGEGSISGCTVSGVIRCRQACNNLFAGGMFGFLNPTTGSTDKIYLTVDGCFADVAITGAPMYAGGFAGYLGSCGKIVNCGSVGDVTMTEPYANMPYAGGFIGSLETMNGSVMIESCYATGNVSLTSSTEEIMICAGGFCGGIDIPEKAASIQGCMSSGDVAVTASENISMVLAGGFIGNGAEQPILTVANSYSTGDVTAANGTYVICGGFIGYGAPTVESCYSLGNAISTNGGTCGWAFGFNGWTMSGASFTNCYALGTSMDGSTHTANFLNGNHSLNNCFYYEGMELKETNVSNPTVTALSEDAIMGATAFSGFDSNVWQLSTGSIPILAGIPDGAEKTDKPIYLLKTITFDTQGGTPVDSQPAAKNGTVTKPTDPAREGYTFGGWYKEAACITAWNFESDTVETDMTLYAKWDVITYTVTFDSCGGSAVDSQTIESGGKAARPAAPARTGHAFGGWYKEAACTTAWNFESDTVSENMTLYAKWEIITHTVTFHAQNGTDVTAVQVNHGSPVSKPAVPAKDGCLFGGWYTDASGTDAYDFTAAVTGQITLYAKWLTVLPDPPAGEGDTQFQLVMVEGVSELPAELSGKYESAGALEEAMKLEIAKAATGVSEENTAVYDVTLMVSNNGGETWSAATKESFPAGGLTVTLPYPDGTNSSYVFTVVHMFTTNDFDKTPGDIETPTVTNTPAGIRFTVTGLSPVSVGWKAPAHSGGSGGGGGSRTYAVTVEKPEHGKVTADRASAAAGTIVTLTVTPDSGYVLDTLTVTGSQGGEIKMSEQGDGKYTFTMPSRAVSVKAMFASGQAGQPAWRNPYADVAADAWYYDAVWYVTENGLMSGYGNGSFGPNSNLSRAQLAQILYNREGAPAVTSGSAFTDVPSGAWYAPAVTWAAAQNVVAGYGNGMFGPNGPITREQLAVMLWRYAGCPAASGTAWDFADADSVSAWAQDALRWAVEQGIVSGKDGGVLATKDCATRAEAAAMLMRYLGK